MFDEISPMKNHLLRPVDRRGATRSHSVWVVAAMGLACLTVIVAAQPPAVRESPPANAAPAEAPLLDDLAVKQGKIADKYARLEQLLIRMSELEATNNPQRAALLKRAAQQSSEKLTRQQLNALIKLLAPPAQLKRAVDEQQHIVTDLKALLDLLQSENRADRLKSEQARVKDYIKEVDRLIRLQQGVQGRTEGGDDSQKLAKDQGQIGDRTGQLAKRIQENEEGGTKGEVGDSQSSDSKSGEPKSDSKQANGKSGGAAKSKDEGKSGSEKSNSDKSGDDKSGKKDPSGDDSKGKNAGKDASGKDAGKKETNQKEGADKGSSKEGDSKQPPDKSSNGKGSPNAQKQDNPAKSSGQGKKAGDSKGKSPGQGQESPENEQPPPGEQPESEPEQGNPARKRLQAAEERMREAQRKLSESKQKDAAADQEKAREELEKAKAELEQILRQMREEEIERTLAMLEGRFRRMLESQLKIYESTKRLDKVPAAQRSRDIDIQASKLGFEQGKIAVDADKALLLLREEGSSVAFPETVEMMRDDMQQVADRLSVTQIDRITQGIEEEIIQTLEELIAALQKAQQDLKDKKPPPPMQPQQPQDPSQRPLVDQLAELRMIRALQMRINTRTQRYSRLLDNVDDPVGRANSEDLRQSLVKLAELEKRVHEITRNLVLGKNE